ncbi:MAG TPA: serine/threonine-protein kinase [Acidisarcina sp.]
MTPLAPGETLDHYRLDSLVARSGMATIYRATDLNGTESVAAARQPVEGAVAAATSAGSPWVAIKVPHMEVESDPALFERFKREELIGVTMDHPGVVKVLKNEGRSRVYMVMEWVDGTLLRDMLKSGQRIDPERAVRITINICDALEYIHTHGVVHRDLKPENIMVDANDGIKLIDFGIAANAGSRRLTFAAFSPAMGTPDYIAPEQVRGKRGDARTDIYATGVMLYEMLTGKVPFEGPNPLAVMNDRLLNDPTAPREIDPSISPQLQEIVFRALEREPTNRYHTAREMGYDLRHQDQVGVTVRAVTPKGQKRRTVMRGRIIVYCCIALIPFLVFALLLFTAKHK